MTNKEKFKEVFSLEIDDTSDCGFFDCTYMECTNCPVKDTNDWWNAEYKEPRKAIWIERSDIPRGYGEYLCSNCMDEYGTDLLSVYCPNCGAYHGKNKETIKEKDFCRSDHPEEFMHLLKEEKESEFHCGVEESEFHAYNCNDCPNKCDEWYQWDKEFRKENNDETT